jgi:hypothetical protein
LYWEARSTLPVCTDDAWEPNNVVAEAVPMPLARTISAEICSSDADYYDLGTVSRSFGLRITLNHISANGDLNIRLLRYGSEVASSATSADSETIVYWPPFGGDLLLVVEGSQTGVANDYTIRAEFAGAFACELFGDDVAAEPDDTAATAVSLAANDGRDAAICGNDDWVLLPSVQAGDEIVASLFFDQGVGDLDLWVFPDLGASGTYDTSAAAAASRSTSDNEHVRFVAVSAGDYRARIEGFSGDLGRYRFVWDTVSYICDDPFEPNNRYTNFPSLAFQTSTQIFPSTTYAANLCASDLDNFELGRFGVGQQIEVAVIANVGEFEVELYDGLTSVQLDATTSLSKTLTFTTTDDDEHTLAIRPLNGASVSYSVSYQVL